jgi:death-on-curing protein
MTDYLTVVEVLAIHDDQIKRYGGTAGVRDFGLLEAALFRPRTGYYADLIEEAAALWESLSQNHPFVDGNKRTAFAVTYTFLVINRAILTATASEIEAFVMALYAAKNKKSGYSAKLPLTRASGCARHFGKHADGSRCAHASYRLLAWPVCAHVDHHGQLGRPQKRTPGMLQNARFSERPQTLGRGLNVANTQCLEDTAPQRK